MAKITVIGIGSWGTALSMLLNRNGHEVTLYGRVEDGTDEINKSRVHPYLDKCLIDKKINITTSIGEASLNNILVIAVPSQHIRSVLQNFKDYIKENSLLINVSKGIEITSGLRISQIVNEIFTDKISYAVLSGPTHAEEVAKELPAAIVAASRHEDKARLVQDIFSNDHFRVYWSRDVVGVEIAGTIKNVMAIAAGAIDGLKLGDNAKAALITRGLQEIIKFGAVFGGKKDTFFGLAGIGDLMVTCMSKHSRNRLFGELLGKGKKPKEIILEIKMVAEGYYSTEAIYILKEKFNVEMPIVDEIYKMLYHEKNIQASLLDLMNRELKIEVGGNDGED